jgi:hypothetical protein
LLDGRERSWVAIEMHLLSTDLNQCSAYPWTVLMQTIILATVGLSFDGTRALKTNPAAVHSQPDMQSL